METIVEAAALLHKDPSGGGIVIRLVGDGPTRAGLERRAGELGLTNVEFLDMVSKPELVELAPPVTCLRAFASSHEGRRAIRHERQ